MNIAEILKYCPKGTKLYSPIFGDVVFDEVCSETNKYPIKIQDYAGFHHAVTEHGYYLYNIPNSECVLFPSKTQRDWNKFRLPIKKGDIMMNYDGNCPFIAIGELYENISPKYICGINSSGEFIKYPGKGGWTTDFYIPASEEAKKELFDKMEEAGYKWNADTLKLELNKNNIKPIKQKFKPFDKVLVRNESNEKWSINLFSYYDEEDKYYPYVCLSNHYKECIPYGDYNKHVLGTTINPNK